MNIINQQQKNNTVTIEVLTKAHEKRLFVGAKKDQHDIIYILNRKTKQVVDITLLCDRMHTSLHLTILSIGSSKHTIVQTHQIHKASDTKSTVLVKSIVPSQSQFEFHGGITIEKHAHGSDAYQQNKNIILSNTANVISEPTLEIKNNDVRCSHGVSTATIPSDSIWYMTSRGISLKKARAIYLTGFMFDAIEHVQDSKIQTMIYNQITTIC